ncbi:hypothetical protein VNI00_006798 [Paramarasmius palmivorus]|uniref:Uncharacterized protein n=1 Tax=Paramarasmius palmivorus TaxID=297713 RepID=A0AAW0D4N5_9AGAR
MSRIDIPCIPVTLSVSSLTNTHPKPLVRDENTWGDQAAKEGQRFASYELEEAVTLVPLAALSYSKLGHPQQDPHVEVCKINPRSRLTAAACTHYLLQLGHRRTHLEITIPYNK